MIPTIVAAFIVFAWTWAPGLIDAGAPSSQPGYVRRINPPTREIRNKMMKIKNRIFAIPAAAAAIPKKPNIAAIIATIRNTTAHPNMAAS